MLNAPEFFGQDLAPAPVWAHFATLCQIPRPSAGEAALVAHLQAWASAQGLAHATDATGNLLLKKPASPGYAAAPATALQAHLDMVCQANADTPHDFGCDPIRTRIKDGWLMAPHTTLGADNGIGVALALAALEDRTLCHGPLEVLLTVDEEAGMGGARGLQPGWLTSRRMLNLDTEAWGEFFLGCAGGLDVEVQRTTSIPPDSSSPQEACFRLQLSGLRGGHSGVDIHEQRGNAIKLLVRVLADLQQRWPLRLASLSGGTARNALPREAVAEFALPGMHSAELQPQLDAWQAHLRQEFGALEPGLNLHCTPLDGTLPLMPQAEQAIWLHSLHAAPYGVERMSDSVPGVVETSNNIGIASLNAHGGMANFMVRSLVDSGAQALAERIVSLFALSNSSVECSGHYPGWTPNPDSALLRQCQRVFSTQFGEQSSIHVIHAGLECGLIGAIYPGMDIVSFGPTIRSAHAPGERVEIASVARCWQLLTALLADRG